MKEVVYTAVFLALAIILLVVFLIMFGSGKNDSAKKTSAETAISAENARYIPGIYTSTISLGDQTFDVPAYGACTRFHCKSDLRQSDNRRSHLR